MSGYWTKVLEEHYRAGHIQGTDITISSNGVEIGFPPQLYKAEPPMFARLTWDDGEQTVVDCDRTYPSNPKRWVSKVEMMVDSDVLRRLFTAYVDAYEEAK